VAEGDKKNRSFSNCACHPCAGAMLILSFDPHTNFRSYTRARETARGISPHETDAHTAHRTYRVLLLAPGLHGPPRSTEVVSGGIHNIL